MDSKQFILKETLYLAIGEAVLTAAMIGIFALTGGFSAAVLLGGIVGLALAVGNFFLMAVAADAAADRAVNNDVKGGKAAIKSSFLFRMLIIFGIIALLAKSGACNPLSMVLPLVFARPVLTVVEFFRKAGGNQK